VLDSLVEFPYYAVEGHSNWCHGLLYDNLIVRGANANRPAYVGIGLYNRGDAGTGHGWAAAHSVVWNCDTGGTQIIVQQPPTAQNYAVGCRADGSAPDGKVWGHNKNGLHWGHIERPNARGLVPRSLYLAQLHDRLSPDGLRAWRLRQGLDENGADDLASAGDGVPHLLKFAFNLADAPGDLTRPCSSRLLDPDGNAGLPAAHFDAERAVLRFQFVRRRDQPAAEIVYAPQVTADLAEWFAPTTPLTFTSIDSRWERVTIESAEKSLFFRVRVQPTDAGTPGPAP